MSNALHSASQGNKSQNLLWYGLEWRFVLGPFVNDRMGHPCMVLMTGKEDNHGWPIPNHRGQSMVVHQRLSHQWVDLCTSWLSVLGPVLAYDNYTCALCLHPYANAYMLTCWHAFMIIHMLHIVWSHKCKGVGICIFIYGQFLLLTRSSGVVLSSTLPPSSLDAVVHQWMNYGMWSSGTMSQVDRKPAAQ